MFHSKKFYSLLVLYISVNLVSCTFEDLCDISNDCDGKTAGYLVQDPLDCHGFSECILNGDGEVVVADTVASCSSGEYFDEENQQCTEETFQCVNKCSNLLCVKTCDGLSDGTRIPYPNYCQEFQVCFEHDELPTFGFCSFEAPYFNGTDCTTDIYSCCDICTPYCELAFTQVEDPYDCRSFYLCEEDDYIPGSLAHFECESDTHFNRTLGECVQGEGCISVC